MQISKKKKKKRKKKRFLSFTLGSDRHMISSTFEQLRLHCECENEKWRPKKKRGSGTASYAKKGRDFEQEIFQEKGFAYSEVFSPALSGMTEV